MLCVGGNVFTIAHLRLRVENKDGAMVPLTTPVDPAILRDEACELAAILRLFRGGRLIMDEVDLILHPLKVNILETSCSNNPCDRAS